MILEIYKQQIIVAHLFFATLKPLGQANGENDLKLLHVLNVFGLFVLNSAKNVFVRIILKKSFTLGFLVVVAWFFIHS
jgi:hypothetical protein